MCTVVTLYDDELLFGRNMDLEQSFNEEVVITPRNFKFKFKNNMEITTKYSYIGMATLINNYPLYAEAISENGLALAGLNFPNNSTYLNKTTKLTNKDIAPYELFHYLLSQAKDTKEALELLKDINIINYPFIPNLKVVSLHWILSDKNNKSYTLEFTDNRLNIYENKLGVLTNNPVFPYHLNNIVNYNYLSTKNPEEKEINNLNLTNYCEGLGTVGLPGDFSSPSRFVKSYFLKMNTPINKDNKIENINQLFHILDSVAMVRGSVITENNNLDITRYSSVLTKNAYYYKTYSNHQINKIELTDERKNSKSILNFKLNQEECINVI